MLLNTQELLPCLCSDRCGQVLQIVRSGSGVNDLVEVCFFLEQQLLVAGYTLSKICRTLVGYIKRRNGDLVHTSQSSTHRLGLAAQQVDVCIEDSHVELARLGADVHLGCVLQRGGEDRSFVCLNDLCP